MPPVYIPRTYAGITSGSERSLFRPPAGYPGAPPRPDVNIVFDQVAYHPPSKSLVYFTGGLTAAQSVMVLASLPNPVVLPDSDGVRAALPTVGRYAKAFGEGDLQQSRW